LLALIGAVLGLAAFYATTGAREAADGPTSAPAPAAEQKGVARKAAGEKGAKGTGRTPAIPARPPALKARLGPQPPAPPAKARPAPKLTAPGAKARPKPRATAAAGAPAKVMRALARRRTLVLFFYQRGSADDAATARAVSSVRGRAGVAVFSAPISRLADYRGVIGGAGVSQAPALVIVDRKRRARLLEGFVDKETLAQEVADSR